MKIITHSFSSLDLTQLYDILQLRAAVFVVEQDCVYQDIDGKDQNALHIIGTQDNKIVAYTRVFKPGDYLDKAAIGRVVVHPDYRKQHLGKTIMMASIQAIQDHFNPPTPSSGQRLPIGLSAQTYLLDFYKELGFVAVGDAYLEDGIPHIYMERS